MGLAFIASEVARASEAVADSTWGVSVKVESASLLVALRATAAPFNGVPDGIIIWLWEDSTTDNAGSDSGLAGNGIGDVAEAGDCQTGVSVVTV